MSTAFSPDDALYGASNFGQTLYRIDPASGRALASVPLTGTTHFTGAVFNGEITAIDFAPDGTLYGIGFSLYTINPNTGVATKVSPTAAQVSGQLYGSLDFGPDGILRAATAVSGDGASSQLHAVDPRTGVGSVVGNTGVRIGALASRAIGSATDLADRQAAAASATAAFSVAGLESSDRAVYQEVVAARLARIHAAEEDRARLQR